MRKDYLPLIRAVRQLAEDDPEGAELFCTSPEFRRMVMERMQRQQESEEKLEYLLRLMNKHNRK